MGESSDNPPKVSPEEVNTSDQNADSVFVVDIVLLSDE